MKVKVKIWIEDKNSNLLFGGGKTQILDLIEQTGSISEASKRVGMNYKKAWTHIKILQEYIEDELVIVNKGRNTGGTVLTPKAKQIIKNYKLLQEDINTYAQKRFEELFLNEDNLIRSKKENDV